MKNFSCRWCVGLLLGLVAGLALAQAPAGQVMVATGSVRAIDAQGRERALEKGGEIRAGDRIITAADGLVQLRMSDGGYLSVRAGTEMAIDKFLHDDKDPEKSSFLVSLVKGGFRSITGLIGRSNPAAYRITTNTATIGIRGTDHEPMVIPPGPPNIPVVEVPGVYDKVNVGETFIQNALGILSLKAGQVGFAPLRPDTAPQIVVKLPDFYKDEAKTDRGRQPEGRDEKSDGKRTAPITQNQLRPTVAGRLTPLSDTTVSKEALFGTTAILQPATSTTELKSLTTTTTTLQPLSTTNTTLQLQPLSTTTTTLQPLSTTTTTLQPLTTTIQPITTTIQPITTTIQPITTTIQPITTTTTTILQSPTLILK